MPNKRHTPRKRTPPGRWFEMVIRVRVVTSRRRTTAKDAETLLQGILDGTPYRLGTGRRMTIGPHTLTNAFAFRGEECEP